MSTLNFYVGSDIDGPRLKKAVAQAAEKSNMSQSEWLRRVILDQLRREGIKI